MLQACWAFDPEGRPNINDIIDLFMDNPELLQPCLDAPSTAVALDTTGDLEMDMPTKHRQYRMSQGANRISIGNASISEHSRDGGTASKSGGAHSPTSPPSSATDPFSLLGSMTQKAGAKIAALPSVIRSPLSRSMSVGDSRAHTCHHSLQALQPEMDTSCAQAQEAREEGEDGEEGEEDEEGEMEECSTTETLCHNGNSPPTDVPAHLPRHFSIPTSLEDRADSDYYSDQSKASPHCNHNIMANNINAVHAVV